MWEQNRNGSIYLCERSYDPLTGRSRTLTVKVSKDTATARKEAQRRLLAKLEDSRPDKRLHLSDLIELYLKEHERTVRQSTYYRDEKSLNSTLGIVGDVYIDMMTAGYIRRKMIESGRENSTLNEFIKRFKTFLMWAYRNDYIEREVADKLTLFPDKTAKQKVADKYLEKEELQALLDGMDIERWRLLTQFLALSGLRIGEAIALDNTDIDTEYIHVRKSYSETFATLGETKTDASNRDVFIQPELMAVIKKIRTCMKKQALLHGYEDKGYFMSGIDGGRVGYAAYNKYLKDIAQKVVPDKQVTPHTLRHTMTSLFSEAGVPLDIISRRLGHENSAITRNIYLHQTEGHKKKDNREVASVTLLA